MSYRLWAHRKADITEGLSMTEHTTRKGPEGTGGQALGSAQLEGALGHRMRRIRPRTSEGSLGPTWLEARGMLAAFFMIL